MKPRVPAEPRGNGFSFGEVVEEFRSSGICRSAGGPPAPHPMRAIAPDVRIGVKICVLLLIALSALPALAAPRLAVPPEGVAFGEIAAGEGASKSIEIQNVSTFPVAVAQVKGCCGADASLSAMLIAPSESATLTVSLHPMLPGEFSKDIRILCDDPERPLLTIPATGVATEGTSAGSASRYTLPAILLAGIVGTPPLREEESPSLVVPSQNRLED